MMLIWKSPLSSNIIIASYASWRNHSIRINFLHIFGEMRSCALHILYKLYFLAEYVVLLNYFLAGSWSKVNVWKGLRKIKGEDGRWVGDTLPFIYTILQNKSMAWYMHSQLGTVHKGRPLSGGERWFVQCRHFTDMERGGSSDADGRTFWCNKTPDFSKFMVCPHGQGEVESVRTFFGQEGKGSIFRDFVRSPLWTAS